MMHYKKVLTFLCILWCISPCAYGQIDCTDPAIAKTYNIVVAYDEACVTQLGGESAARDKINLQMDAAINSLNTLFMPFNLNFNVILFSKKQYPNNLEPTGSNNNITIIVRNELFCVPYNGLVYFKGNWAGGFTIGSTSTINAGSSSSSLIIHEIGHQIFGGGHTDDGPCSGSCTGNFMTSNFMCHDGDLLSLTACQASFLNSTFFANGCPSLLFAIEPLPDDFECPDKPLFSLSVDKKFLIRGCDGDRKNLTGNLTITGGSVPTTITNVKVTFQDHIYDFDLASMGIDFNAVADIPGGVQQKELRRLVDPNGPLNGPQDEFILEPGESRVFMFKLKYNPDDSTVFIASPLAATIKASIKATLTPPNLPPTTSIIDRSVAPRAVMPVDVSSGFVSFDKPVIVTGDITLPTISNIFPWTSPLTLVKPGGSIRVPSGVKLSLHSIKPLVFEGCGGMWDGIRVDQNASIDLVQVEIRDAINGLDVRPNAGAINATNSIFSNNETGIRFGGAMAVAPTLSGLIFNQTAPLKPQPTGNKFSLWGIHATNAGALGISKHAVLGYGGKFDGIRNGIYAENTNLSVDASLFSNMTIPGAARGTGLQANSGAITVENSSFDAVETAIRATGGSLNINDNFFSNIAFEAISTQGSSLLADNNKILSSEDGVVCNSGAAKLTNNLLDEVVRGVTATGTLLTAELNTFTNVHRGIHASLCTNMVLRKNTISAKDFGISFFHQALDINAARVEENTITMAGNSEGIGIYTGGTTGVEQLGGSIFNNTIHIKEGQSGIAANSANSVSIVYNHIDLAENEGIGYGIRLENGDNLTITDNDVVGHSISDATAQRGIYGMHTSRSFFSCNYTDNTAYGFNFAGECSGKKSLFFQNNSINNHENGLLMGLPPANGNAIIGPQIHHKNRWAGSYTGPGALHLGGQSMANLSPFFADDQADNTFIPDVVSPSSWFTNQTGDDSPLECNRRPERNDEDGRHDLNIASGLIKGRNDGGAMLWLAQRRLYERIMGEENGDTDNRTLHEFITSASQSDIDAYASMRQSIQKIGQMPASDQMVLRQYDALINQRLTELHALQGQLATPTLNQADKYNIEQEIQSVQTDLDEQMALKEKLMDDLAVQRNERAMETLAQITTLGGEEIFKVNERTVYRVLLEKYAARNGELNKSQIIALENVALQCPITGGDAVLLARLLLQQQSDVPLSYNDEAVCRGGARSEERSEKAAPLFESLKVSPIPANTEIRIEYSSETNKTLDIVDALGRICHQVQLPSAQNSIVIPVAQLTNGLYYYHINGIPTGKLVVLH